MKALILAGGFSTRLYPLTEYTPKALLEIGGKPILWQIFSQILSAQKKGTISEIALVSNHRYLHVFKEWLRQQELDEDVLVLDNKANDPSERLGAIGDLMLLLEKTEWNDDLLVVASDTLSSLKIEDVLAFFAKNRGVLNTVYDTKDATIIAGKLGNPIVDKNNRITSFLEKPLKPKGTLTSIPYYIFTKESLPLIKKYYADNKDNLSALDSPGSVLTWLIKQTPTYAYVVADGYYHDVGTPEVLKKLRAQQG